MRIQFTTEGGFAAFPGLTAPVTIDTTQLPAQDAVTLTGLVGAARFFERTAVAGSSEARDNRQFTITVEDGDRRNTVRVSEPVADPDLAALVAALQRQAAAQRARAANPPSDASP